MSNGNNFIQTKTERKKKMKIIIRKSIVERSGIKFAQFKLWVDKLYDEGRGSIKLPCTEVYRCENAYSEVDDIQSPVRQDVLHSLWLGLCNEFDSWTDPVSFFASKVPFIEGVSGMGFPAGDWFELQ